MRTAIPIAAPPRRLRWQAAFTIKLAPRFRLGHKHDELVGRLRTNLALALGRKPR